MGMTLFAAHNQWSTRPADERFETIQELFDVTRGYANSAREKKTAVSDIRTEAIDGDVQLVGRAGNPAKLTHWSFGQLAARIGAPAGYLRELPATLAVQNLNHGLKQYADKADVANLMFHSNGSLLLRAFTSDDYARIWNWEVAERLLELERQGWTPARPDFRFDGGDVTRCQACSGSGNTLQLMAPQMPVAMCMHCKGTGRALPALYASDHDMFAFVRNNSAIIREPGNPDGLQRGVIVQNSEVGASALKLTRFLYRALCGNHIIWGASRVMEIKVRHVGNARDRWHGYEAELREYLNQGAAADEAKISAAKRVMLGSDKDSVLDKLFGIRSIGLSRKMLSAGYDATRPDEDGDPNSVWGIVQGLTRHSQTLTYADARTAVDAAAGKLMEVEF